jgi:hypothetical protein
VISRLHYRELFGALDRSRTYNHCVRSALHVHRAAKAKLDHRLGFEPRVFRFRAEGFAS